MPYINMNDNNGIIGDYGTIDNSTNITINHFNQRYNLKERFDNGNEEYEYSAYCVGQFGEKAFKGCIPVTFTNLHSQNKFMYDHLHIDVPIEWYSKLYFDGHIIKFKAKVHDYDRKNKSKDYTLTITEIYTEDSSKQTAINFVNSLKYPSINIIKENFDDGKYILEKEYSQETIAEFTIRLLTMLDISLASIDQSFYSGFITNFILTQYFLNTNLNEQCNQLYIIRQLNKEILIDLALIVSDIIMKFNKGKESLYKYQDIFSHIAYICNILQKANKNASLRTNLNKNDYDEEYNNIKEFGNKIEHNETKKMFDKLKKRHHDFGFKYPKNETELDNEIYSLWNNLLTMAHHLGYINILV